MTRPTGRRQDRDRARRTSRKIYRRYGGRQFATLKSALLQRSILRDLQPSETFPALQDVSFARARRVRRSASSAATDRARARR